MKEIKPDTSFLKAENDTSFFNPYSVSPVDGRGGDGVMRCICGYELLKADGDVYKCSGGNHRYLVGSSKLVYDKFGNPSILLPKPTSNPQLTE
jgi:hypothetical protein